MDIEDRYEVRTSDFSLAPEYLVFDKQSNYVFRRVKDREHADVLAEDLNEKWRKMVASETHFTSTRTDRRGTNNNYGRRGGNFRESEAHCSCGWSATSNGQTYAESVQEIREHLKEVDVYTTPLEQTVYAHIGKEPTLLKDIVERSGKTEGRVKKALAKLVERGNVEILSGYYAKTDKWFSWND